MVPGGHLSLCAGSESSSTKRCSKCCSNSKQLVESIQNFSQSLNSVDHSLLTIWTHLFLPDHQAALSSCCVPPWLPSCSTSRYLALGSQHLTFYVGKGYIFHMQNTRPGSPHGCTLCRIAVGSILKTIILKLLLWLLFPYFHFSLVGGFASLWNSSHALWANPLLPCQATHKVHVNPFLFLSTYE